MSSSNLVRIGYKKEVTMGVTPAAIAATGTLATTTPIILTSVLRGLKRNTNTFTVNVGSSSNPTDTVLANFSGTKAAIVLDVTLNDGTNNSATPVTITTAQLRELITTGAVAGKNINLTDAQGLRALQTATGGGAASLAEGGEGDGEVATFSGGSGSFKTARFISEQYSGTPETVESAQIRTDRMSSGQVVTGLTVDGGHSFELAKEEAIEDFMESAMNNSWVTSTSKSATLTLDVGAQSLTRSAGSFLADGVVVGDFIKLSGFVNPENNVIVMVMEIEVGGGAMKIAVPPDMIPESGVAASFQVCDKISIGITKKPLTVEKAFLDMTDKALIYRGCLVSQMDLEVAYGSLITGSFQTQGTDYESADAASEFASYNTDFQDPATTNTLNGSVDMPFVATDVTGVWAQDAFCLQNLSLSLANNLTVQNCIGRAAPQDYSLGTAQITADLSSYLRDSNWGLLAKKLSQEAFALGFMVKNTDGWYGFYMPALQVSFDDPQSGGANQEVSMEMSGSAKVGPSNESSLTIYREPTV